MAAQYAAVVATDTNGFGRMGRLFGDNIVHRDMDPTGRGDARFSVYDEDGTHLVDFNMEIRDD